MHASLTDKSLRRAVHIYLCPERASPEQRAWLARNPIEGWDVSRVTNMAGLFVHKCGFNADISGWNVSQVTDMRWMFSGAATFNQPIGAWNLACVTDIRGMFCHASAFNQPIGRWSFDRITNMSHLFSHAVCFNQPIASWDVRAVTNMEKMFAGATRFNQPIGAWDMRNVRWIDGMFAGADSFYQPLGGWTWSKDISLHACPFHRISARGLQLLGTAIAFDLSDSDPNHLRQYLRVHDMMLTVHTWGRSRWVGTLPDDVVRELWGWIGLPSHYSSYPCC